MMSWQHTDLSQWTLSTPEKHPTRATWLPGAANGGIDFRPLLWQFETISLAQMADVALLRRTEMKYILSETQLYQALAALSAHYWVLDIEHIRLNEYQTLYFDTADFALYHRHHAGSGDRYKVRSRNYVDTNLSFLEIKHKINKNRTIKSRLPTPSLVTDLSADTNSFVQTHLPALGQTLEPKLWNEYHRMTLVSKYRTERLTLDVQVQFGGNGRYVALPGLTIAEIKQDHPRHDSDFIRQMRAMNIRSTGLSKYCLGVTLLYPTVKHNNFKPKLRQIEKIITPFGASK